MTKRPIYDDEATEAIRRDLSAYKRSTGKGAPWIAARISEVNQVRSGVDQRRVARFLAKTTKDPDAMFLGWCEAFLKTLPEPPDNVFRLAQGLSGFCRHGDGVDYSGHYHLTVLSLPDLTPNPYPSAEFKCVRDEGFWRVEERSLDRHLIHDGALINTTTGGILISMDRLTQITRLCALHFQDDRLIGHTLSINQDNMSARFAFWLEKFDA